MKTETWTALDREFARYPIMMATAVPKLEIHEASKVIGVQFDDDYVAFLERYGGAMVGAYPIFGLRMSEVMGEGYWSVVDVTHKFNRDGWSGIERWYIVSTDAAGNPIGIAPDGKVWISDHNAGSTYELASSFEEFIRDCLKLSKN